VIAALIEVHRNVGPGMLESVYEACVSRELTLRGLPFERQRPVPLSYKDVVLESAYRLDLVVGNRVLVELKAVDDLLPVHVAQVITYLHVSRLPVGLLVNFNVPVLKQGLRRVWPPKLADPPPSPDPTKTSF
jgi:GxxExxY protein